jgi:pilus assembly protein CpaF
MTTTQVPQQQPAGRWGDRGPGSMQREQALEDMRQKMHQFVIHELGPLLTGQERQHLVQSVTDDVLGYGPIDQLLRDESITEVMVNGPSQVYIERAGRIELTDVRFTDEVHVRRIIDKIVS